MEDARTELALWRMYKHLGGEVMDAIPSEGLASYLAEALGIGADGMEGVHARIACVRANRARLRELLTRPHIPQRSPEWYALRRQRLTASDAAQALGKGKFGTRKDLVTRKQNERIGQLAPFNSNLPPLKWGTMFEPMATRCYQEARGGVHVHEFGLIPHPTLGCFGASPDGITELGTMIEIKCPYRRKITGEIPEQYWIQMQGQMAVCGIQECDYIECDMEVLENPEIYYERVAGTTSGHGVIVEYSRDGQSAAEYDYSEPGMAGLPAYRSMEQRAAARMRSEPDLHITRFIVWRLRYMNIQRVVYDHEKWMAMVPQIQAFWDEVVSGVPAPTLPAKGRTLALGDASPGHSPVRAPGTQGKYQFLESDDDSDE